MAVIKINEKWNQNQIPILVGGTGLYFKALIEGLVNIPDIPNNLRSEIRKLLLLDTKIYIYNYL